MIGGHIPSMSRRGFVAGAALAAALRRNRFRAQTSGFGVVRVSVPDLPSAAVSTGIGGAWVTLLNSSTLLAVSPEGRVSGGLAVSWTIAADRRTLDLRLRPDALFSDGVRVMADDVVASFAYARDRYAETEEAWRWEHVDAIEAIADDTTRLSLTAPDAALPALFASPLVPVLPAAWIGREWKVDSGASAPASGSFQLESVAERRVRFSRNDVYFQVGRPRLAGVVCNSPADGTLRTTELVTNEADLLIDVPLLDVPTLRENPGLTLVGGPTNRLCLLVVNLASPRLADVRVRRLLSQAIDREALVQGATAGEAMPVTTLLPPGHWAGLDEPFETLGADEVRAGLADLGLPPGVELRLVASDVDGTLANACVLLQEQLALAGIAISLDLLDATEMETELRLGGWDVIMRQLPSWRDPHEVIRPLVVSDGTRNTAGYVNSRVDYLAGLAARASDNAYRAGFYETIQRIIGSDVPVIPLYVPNYYDAMTIRIEDYPFFPPVSAAAMRQATMRRPDPIAFP